MTLEEQIMKLVKSHHDGLTVTEIVQSISDVTAHDVTSALERLENAEQVMHLDDELEGRLWGKP